MNRRLLRQKALFIGFVAFTTIFVFTCNKIQQNEQARMDQEYLDFLENQPIPHREKSNNTIKILNPPQLTASQDEILTNLSSGDKEILAELLSDIVQSQLKAIQTPKSCNASNFICGHSDSCGFACQVHHRAACLMISYALSLPLIQDEDDGWPFSKKLSDFFEPLGTNCTSGNNTFRWNWLWSDILYRGSDEIEFPLVEGLPVAKKLADLVEKVQPDPFLWWAGQFIKFALKPIKTFRDKLELQKKAIGFSHPIVGFHVRRTDKIFEANESHHEIEEYMNITGSKAVFVNQTIQRKLFIASDDSEVLPDAQTKYPNWRVTGFLTNVTLHSQGERVDRLEDIARDVLILSECDFIVCGMSSNVCRLLRAMLSSKRLSSQQKLVSIDGSYNYLLAKVGSLSQKIIKVVREIKQPL